MGLVSGQLVQTALQRTSPHLLQGIKNINISIKLKLTQNEAYGLQEYFPMHYKFPRGILYETYWKDTSKHKTCEAGSMMFWKFHVFTRT